MHSFHFRKSFSLFLLLFASVFSNLLAQEKKSDYLGVLFSGESHQERFNPNIGLMYEWNFSQKFGAEVGIFYRTFFEEQLITISSPTVFISDYVRYVLGFVGVPVLLRYDVGFAHLSLGPQVDIFTDWTQVRKGEITLDSYSRSPRVRVGPMLKIGREIPFKETLIFEPELRGGIRSFQVGERYFGIGLKVKKGIKKE